MALWAVSPKGTVPPEALDLDMNAYIEATSSAARVWLGDLSVNDLYELKDGIFKYIGEAIAEEDTKAALERVRFSDDQNGAIGSLSALLLADILFVDKDKVNPFDMIDFNGSFVPQHQADAQILIMEGSESKATTASAHMYQAAAKTLCAKDHQGGRALWALRCWRWLLVLMQ